MDLSIKDNGRMIILMGLEGWLMYRVRYMKAIGMKAVYRARVYNTEQISSKEENG